MKHIIKISVVALALALTGTFASANPFSIPQVNGDGIVTNDLSTTNLKDGVCLNFPFCSPSRP